MKLINSYFDYLIALIEKGSDDLDIQKETKNALRILRQYPERYKVYVENKRKGKSLLELGISEKDIRLLVRMQLTTRQIKQDGFLEETVWDLDEMLPDMFDSKDILTAMEELPLEDLLTNKGALKNMNAIFERCLLEVIRQGKVDEVELRNDVAKRFHNVHSLGLIVINQPVEYVDVICFINNDAPIEDLTNVLASETGIHLVNRLVYLINSHNITILPHDHPLKILARENEELKAKNEAMKQGKPSKNALKRAKLRAEKEAAKQQALKDKMESYP